MRARRHGPFVIPVIDFTALLLAAALAVASAGCASSVPPAARAVESPAEPVAAAAPVKENPLARKLCDALHTLPQQRKRECCPAASPESLADVCTVEVGAALARGNVTLEPAAVDRCAAAMAARLEGCDWVRPLLPPLPPECAGLLVGRLAAGTACASSEECSDGLFCRGVGPGKPGVCAPPAAPRSPCAVPLDNLSTFARSSGDTRHPDCDGRCFKGQCYPIAPAGGECISTAFCQPGFGCVNGRCAERPLPKVGEECAALAGCTGDAFCGASKRCEPLKATGEACTGAFECRAFACVKAPGADVGSCGDVCGPSLPAGMKTAFSRGLAPDQLVNSTRWTDQ